MTHLGYVRVSTTQQTLDQQFDALEKVGVERFYQDEMSGAIDDRPGLRSLLDYAREGDTVTVVALDRLGRSLPSIIKTIDDLQARGIVIRSLRENVDFSTSVGRMVAAIFGALAEYERSLINERAAAAAREAARVRGRNTGRPRALSPEQVAVARQMRAAGVVIPTIAQTLGVSRATVYRVLGTEPA
ncbi:recombinase family protein [Modestobacter sp. Leaf380]|uniref:recombinase family protein n=1 Tax=Modestobacter sp. Leaf380 TaxID=1736356 RepID=UPI0006FB1A96|nr:recombinase family protein [Modestobacter sp. Leaf380]KQS66426.1 resolvase [Modestobacter sp. Leaf380]